MVSNKKMARKTRQTLKTRQKIQVRDNKTALLKQLIEEHDIKESGWYIIS